MRTTLTLDDDMFAVAKSLAHSKSESLGRVVSDLMRKGLTESSGVVNADDGCDFPVFDIPADSRPVTLEDVKKGEDDW